MQYGERWQVVTGAALTRDGIVVALEEEWRAVVIELVPR